MYVGLGVAYGCAFILKRFQLASGADSSQGGPAFNETIYEIALVVMSAYLAYLVSESLALSGIVTLFFTGICHAHYSYYSVTKEAAITLKRLFEFAAFLSEMFVFAYLGLQVRALQTCAYRGIQHVRLGFMCAPLLHAFWCGPSLHHHKLGSRLCCWSAVCCIEVALKHATCLSFLLVSQNERPGCPEKKRKEKTTLLSVVKEKLMVDLSFPLA